MIDMSKHLAELSPSKRALFDVLLKEKRAAEGADPSLSAPAPIVADRPNRHEPFPLTDMQQAYWVGRSGALRLGMATHMYEEIESRDLDLDRLGRAWRQLVERHDMLRAIVRPDGRQQILERVPDYTIASTDLRGSPADDVAAHLEATRRRMSHQALPSETWPLFELHATRLGETHYRVHVSLDGLLLDGWSYQLLFREWIRRYEDPDAPIAPFEISFRDYVMAELASRDTPAYQHALAYWQRRLPDLAPAPDLPLARLPEAIAEPRFVRRRASLGPEDWGRLKARAAAAGISSSAALVAAFAEVLTTWSRSPRFTLNVPRFNRLPLHPQVNGLIGEFASFTLLEVDNSPVRAFEDRARGLQEQLWRDLDHHQVSGVRVLRELNRLQGRNGEALMPIVFTLMPHAVDARHEAVSLALGDQAVYGLTQTSQVWLDCQAGEDAGALAFNWDSVDDLFPAGLVDDMFDAFRRLLVRLASQESVWGEARPQLVPEAQLAERRRINATGAPIPPALVHELFAEQARRQPEAPAIVTAAGTMTYAELAAGARRLAARLREEGVGPGTLVPIVMEKGPEQAIAVLAAGFAGGAYLPIDPALPEERLRYLLEDSQSALVLTQSSLERLVPWPEAVRRIAVDRCDGPPDADERWDSSQTQDDPACVIYTSGSTGRPKGAVIAQRGLVNAIVETNRRFSVGPSDRVLALTALHHDMSAYDLFGLLAAGGALVMPDARSTRDPAAWLRLMERAEVTIWNSVPTFMEMLVEYAAGQQLTLPSSLRLALVGGDWIPVTLPARLGALAPNARVVSVGGPTETTLWNVWYPVEQVDPRWQSIPYGRPIANTRYYVLNQLGEHCPVWVPGVMHCAGAGVARGYWRDEERTRASFIVHPGLGERLYRTGDLGRYLPDGTLEFLGREDGQVKIQGMRIELGEIESTLKQHRLVRAAVATVASGAEGHRYVAAHVVLDGPAAAPAAGIGDFVDVSAGGEVEGVLLDPLARIEFKLAERGLRPFGEERSSFELARPALDEALLSAYASRRSYRSFGGEAIPLAALGEVLSCLWRVEFEGVPVPKYRYPSAGGLYPVQTYLHVREGAVEGLPGGSYYYSPKNHRLVLLEPGFEPDRSCHIAANQPMFDDAAFSLFLVADMDAIAPMYGPLARDFCLVEAGCISQLLMQAAPARQIGLCPVGSVRFEAFARAFGLGERHVLLHGLLGGPVDAAQVSPAGFVAEALARSSAGPASRREERNHAVVAGLHAFLKARLPAHMVPASIAVWDALPLTPNGKIDRTALAANGAAAAAPVRAYAPPRTELEVRIAEIWKGVLRVDRIGVADNFFEVGGNSLQLVQIHSVLQDALQREIDIVDLFQYPTVSALAAMLSGGAGAGAPLADEHARAEMRTASRAHGQADGGPAASEA